MSKKNGTSVASKLADKELAGQIDRLGVLREEKKKLEKEEKDLSSLLKQYVKEGEEIYGQKYKGSLLVPVNRKVVNSKLIKIIGQNKFNEIASVALGVLSDHLGAEQIDRVVIEEDGAARLITEKL